MQILNNLSLHTAGALARADKYLAIVSWAMKRYTRNGCLEISGHNRLSRYSHIETLAWHRYMA